MGLERNIKLEDMNESGNKKWPVRCKLTLCVAMALDTVSVRASYDDINCKPDVKSKLAVILMVGVTLASP